MRSIRIRQLIGELRRSVRLADLTEHQAQFSNHIHEEH
jgi:hypothetical protein